MFRRNANRKAASPSSADVCSERSRLLEIQRENARQEDKEEVSTRNYLLHPSCTISPLTKRAVNLRKSADGSFAITASSTSVISNTHTLGESSEIQDGDFSCSFPGCSQGPFPTGSLLSNHAKNHDQTGLFFCPVFGCFHGKAGKGLRTRKEMLRHGVIHKSRGDRCPFCPDMAHRYPGPEDLML